MTMQLQHPPSPNSPKAFALGYELELAPACWDPDLGLWLDAGTDPSEIWIDASMKEYTPSPTQAKKRLREYWTQYSLELCDDIERNVSFLEAAAEQGSLEGVRAAIRQFKETAIQFGINDKELTRNQASFLSQLVAAKGRALETRLGDMNSWYGAGLTLGSFLRGPIGMSSFQTTAWPDSLFVGLLNTAAGIDPDSCSLYFPRLNSMLVEFRSVANELKSPSELPYRRSLIAEGALDIYSTVCIEVPVACTIEERAASVVAELRSSYTCVNVIRAILEQIQTDLEQQVAKAVSDASGSLPTVVIPNSGVNSQLTASMLDPGSVPATAKASLPKSVRDEQTEARDKYIYDECCRGTQYSCIIGHVKARADWEEIGTPQGVRYAARQYAERHSLPKPPPRQIKRDQQKKPRSQETRTKKSNRNK